MYWETCIHLVLEILLLNSLKYDFKNKSRRKGRGHGSSKGKTCGRGHKGQKCRLVVGNMVWKKGKC